MTSGVGHPRRWPILSVLVVSLLVVVLDHTVLNVALPTIQQDMQASQGELVWAVDAYILVFASLLFTWGVLGDRLGRKRVLVTGLLIFGVASAFCAFAPTTDWLIACRALMGVGGAAVMPTTLAIITVVFPAHERGKAIGVWAATVGAAVALGPVISGLLLEHPEWSNWMTQNDWGSVFLLNVPVVVLGVIGIMRVVPETANPNPRALDVKGLALSVLGLFSLLYGIIHASETRNWLDPAVVIPLLFGLAVIVLFLFLEWRSTHPSFDVSLFRNRGYSVALTAVALTYFALAGITFSLPFYLQVVRGYPTLAAGLCFLPFAVGQILAAPRSASMVNRFGYRKVMTTGLALVCCAMAGLSVLRLDTPLWLILTTFFIFGLGMGNVIAPGSTVLQNVLPLGRAGAGSAVQNTVRQVAAALGVAIFGTVLATQYAPRASQSLAALPPSTTPEATEPAAESLVATVGYLQQRVAEALPPEIAAAVKAAAFNDFLAASHVACFISLVGAIAATVLVALRLPHITPPQRNPSAPTVDADRPDHDQGAPDTAAVLVDAEVRPLTTSTASAPARRDTSL